MRKQVLSIEDVQEYDFKRFDESDLSGAAHEYEFKEFSEFKKSQKEKIQPIIRIERETSRENNFRISPIVKEFRGIEEQEKNERERRIADEVERRVNALKEEAFREGFEEGVEKGKVEIYNELRQSVDEKMDIFNEMIADVLALKEDLLTKQRLEIYETVRNLTKWILLREIKTDETYFNRLLEKLVQEIQTKTNLLIKINKNKSRLLNKVIQLI